MLRTITQEGARLDWDAWYPVAHAAANGSQELLEAVGALSADEQYSLLDNLAADGGPLADFVLATLSAHAEAFSDEQIRAYVLQDSAAALTRRQAFLAELADQLRATIGRLTDRQQSGFDAAGEVAALEGKRNALRAEQIESGHQEISELEWDIARLETLRSRLAAYDPQARRTRRDELRAETERLHAEREAVETSVGEAVRAREEADSALVDARERHAAIVAQAAGLQTEIAAREVELERIQADLPAARARRAELATRWRELDEEQRRLEHLLASPLAEEAERLVEGVRSLYRRLPEDDADIMFGSTQNRARSGR
ncbi:hypothetical protein [Microbacterium lacticum]